MFAGSPSDAVGHAAFSVDASINDRKGLDSGPHDPGGEPIPGRLKRVLGRTWSWALAGKVSDAWRFGVCYTLLLPFFLAPLFATRLLPGLDLPFHLAAADLLSKAGSAGSPYARYYEGGLRVAPYAAHFMALVVLGKVVSLLTAHKIIIIFYVAGLPLAMASLLSTCRRSRLPALLAFPLAYNLTLHYGFISFALSLPVLLLLLAQMTKLVHSQHRRILIARWFVTAAVAVLLFLCHLQNFLYGICAAFAFAMLAAVPFRRRILAAAALLPAFAGVAYWHLSSPPVAGQAKLTPALAWTFLKRHRMDDLGRRTVLADLWDRIISIPAQALRAFVDQSNVVACRGLILIMAAYLVIGLLAWTPADEPPQTRSTRRRRMRLAALVAFLGALTADLALPHHLQELELMTFFPRFSVLVLLMFLLLVPMGLARFRGLLAVLLPLPALVFGALYGRQLYIHYRMYAAEVAGFVAVAEKTPPGGRALGLVFDRRSQVMQIESALIGVPGFYPALRPALGSMVPPNYCGDRHMPCRLKVAPDFMTSPWAPASFLPAKVLPNFDYFFVRSQPPGLDLFAGYHGMVELIAQSGTWAAYRKKPGPLIPDPKPAAPRPLPVLAPPTAVKVSPPPAAAPVKAQAPHRKASTRRSYRLK
jgi:hypothetical protein